MFLKKQINNSYDDYANKLSSPETNPALTFRNISWLNRFFDLKELCFLFRK